ncbi:MAG: colicin V production CvpA [Legionellales bacterium]|nr:colicin V production CvpA [Legionellales bacterium]|tara:strand:- start:15664 stop:16218 length:555 start_codon:yes stop_codon:yes gene_type:complete
MDQSHFLSIADYGIILIFGISILISIVRGFIKESLSLIVWGVAIWLGITFSADVANLLKGVIERPQIRQMVGFLIIFILSLILGAILNHAVATLIKKTGLSGTDRLLGVIFGFLRGTLVVAVLILLGTFTNLPKESWWKNSVTIPYFQDVAEWMRQFVPYASNATDHILTAKTRVEELEREKQG